MRNTLPESVSSRIVSTSEANEHINSVQQSTKKTVKCCPNCGSNYIRYRPSTSDFYCNSCHTHFQTPAERARAKKNSPKAQKRNLPYVPAALKAKDRSNTGKNAYELCEDCRKVFVPVTQPLVHGKRLCSGCAPIEYGTLTKEQAYRKELTKEQNQAHRIALARAQNLTLKESAYIAPLTALSISFFLLLVIGFLFFHSFFETFTGVTV